MWRLFAGVSRQKESDCAPKLPHAPVVWIAEIRVSWLLNASAISSSTFTLKNWCNNCCLWFFLYLFCCDMGKKCICLFVCLLLFFYGDMYGLQQRSIEKEPKMTDMFCCCSGVCNFSFFSNFAKYFNNAYVLSFKLYSVWRKKT